MERSRVTPARVDRGLAGREGHVESDIGGEAEGAAVAESAGLEASSGGHDPEKAVSEIRTTPARAGLTECQDTVAVRAVGPAVSARDPSASVLKAFRSMVDRAIEWRDRARGRRLLMEMDERSLKDIGISRSDAFQESRKPFWRS
jgi:uncharacterized protein YjiS (DUF1127 family)